MSQEMNGQSTEKESQLYEKMKKLTDTQKVN